MLNLKVKNGRSFLENRKGGAFGIFVWDLRVSFELAVYVIIRLRHTVFILKAEVILTTTKRRRKKLVYAYLKILRDEKPSMHIKL